MNITTTAQDFDMNQSIDRFARDELAAALGRISGSIVSIDVYMKDVNGPKGGIDKEVLIRARLSNRQLIALETRHRNLYGAIKKGTKRLRRAVRRSIHKSQRIGRLSLKDLQLDHDRVEVQKA